MFYCQIITSFEFVDWRPTSAFPHLCSSSTLPFGTQGVEDQIVPTIVPTASQNIKITSAFQKDTLL